MHKQRFAAKASDRTRQRDKHEQKNALRNTQQTLALNPAKSFKTVLRQYLSTLSVLDKNGTERMGQFRSRTKTGFKKQTGMKKIAEGRNRNENVKDVSSYLVW